MSCLVSQDLMLHSSTLLAVTVAPVRLPVQLIAIVDRLTPWTRYRLMHDLATNLTL